MRSSINLLPLAMMGIIAVKQCVCAFGISNVSQHSSSRLPQQPSYINMATPANSGDSASATKADLSKLRKSVTNEFKDTRTEIENLKEDLAQRIDKGLAATRTELKEDLTATRVELFKEVETSSQRIDKGLAATRTELKVDLRPHGNEGGTPQGNRDEFTAN
uniref:Uncharacterized protein n=1 Tax=Chaetoceros debilis TaxID=122233 RepID=A0A6S8UJV2_9STRA